MATTQSSYRFTAIPGFFKHYNESNDPSDEVTTTPGLGLIEREYDTDKTFDPNHERKGWERFVHYLTHLNETANDGVSYKLIFAARHGEGYHNVKEAEVGTAAWESYWAKLDGDGKTVWADANLTEKGLQQARDMKVFWEESAVALKLPLPKRHYASPMTRCLDTCQIAFTELTLSDGTPVPPFEPVIKEMVRERLGVHTCDRRHPRTWTSETHPVFSVEEGFSEEDKLWKPDERETLSQHAVRIQAFLDELFANDNEPIISVTCHSGSIQAFHKVISHPSVYVAPGAIVPLFIKAKVVQEDRGK